MTLAPLNRSPVTRERSCDRFNSSCDPIKTNYLIPQFAPRQGSLVENFQPPLGNLIPSLNKRERYKERYKENNIEINKGRCMRWKKEIKGKERQKGSKEERKK